LQKKGNIEMVNMYSEKRKENQICFIYSLEAVIAFSKYMIEKDLNIVSIREEEIHRDYKLIEQYNLIDQMFGEKCFSISFADMTKEKDVDPVNGISKDKIEKILNWAKSQYEKTNKDFIVHCFAGISRSSAVAMLINKMLKDDLFAPYNVKYHSPNPIIIRHGAEILGFNADDALYEIKNRSDEYFSGKGAYFENE
jgi:hypothetical protein